MLSAIDKVDLKKENNVLIKNLHLFKSNVFMT